MNRWLLCSALSMCSFAAACGGGNSVTPPPNPNPQTNYSLASVNGNYTFSMSGTDGNGFSIARIGSFHADGNGNITMGIEDVNDGGSVTTFDFTAGPTSNYTMKADGKGTLTLSHPDPANSSVAVNLQFTMVLSSASGGILVETDGFSTMSGNFQLQTISSAFAQAYAFDVSGVDLNNGTSASYIGQFNTNGVSGVTGGSMDINNGASASGQLTIQPGTMTTDATNFANFGRGQLTLNTTDNSQVLALTYTFYVVDANHIQLLETDSTAATVGTAIAQSNPPATLAAFPGNFVFAVGGGVFNQGLFGPVVRGAKFTADANGTITNLGLDQNYSGGPNAFPKAGGLTNVSYTIDAGGSGRGTLDFTDATSNTIFHFIFYMASASRGFIQDDTANTVADGSIYAQAGPFSNGSLAGTFAVSWSGSNLTNGFEEDFAGVFPLANKAANNITGGSVDFTELGDGKIFFDVPLNGSLVLQGDGTMGGAQGNALQLTTVQAVSTTFNFRAYIIDNDNLLLIGVDNGRVVIGTAQFQK